MSPTPYWKPYGKYAVVGLKSNGGEHTLGVGRFPNPSSALQGVRLRFRKLSRVVSPRILGVGSRHGGVDRALRIFFIE